MFYKAHIRRSGPTFVSHETGRSHTRTTVPPHRLQSRSSKEDPEQAGKSRRRSVPGLADTLEGAV